MHTGESEVTFRQVGLEDAEGWQAAVASIGRERRYLATTVGYPLEQVRTYLENLLRERLPGIVALVDDRLVGWCDIYRKAGAEFHHVGTLGMGVVQGWRRRGIGRQLIERCVACASQAGFERIELIVYGDNEAAISLYRSVGFELEGRKRMARKIDGRYQDELIMALYFQPASTSGPWVAQ